MLNSVVTGSMRWPGRTAGLRRGGDLHVHRLVARAFAAFSAFLFAIAARVSSLSLVRKSGRSAFSRSHSSFFDSSRGSAGDHVIAARRHGIEDPRRRFRRQSVDRQRETCNQREHDFTKV